jgi:3,4-dihydroxy 2-butanone 4-phosphate synthase/GTP cyclohydrolase II
MKQIIQDVRKGKPVIILDDEKREGEGDIFVAAEKVTPDTINFMATNGRGFICMPVTEKRASELGIRPMVADAENTEKERCKFGVSIDAKQGTTTGVSAFDRAVTIRKVVDGKANADDFRKPGHVLPLIARNGGVFVRQGHTEASVDLARIAGLKAAGVICEIMNEDGTMAHGTEILDFAQKHHLKTVRVDEIMKWRVMHEKLVEPIVDVNLPTVHGNFKLHAFRTIDGKEEIALVKGNVHARDILVRVHSECFTGEVFGSLRCDCDDQLQTAMCAIERAGAGIIIYLRQEGRGIGLVNKLKAYKLQEQGLDTFEANKKLGFVEDGRDYWVAAQILKHFGVESVRLISNNPEKEDELKEYGVYISERLSLESMPTRHNLKYLQAKHEKMGHVMDIKEKLIFS